MRAANLVRDAKYSPLHTILGVVPLDVGCGEGKGFLRVTSGVVCGGVTVAHLLIPSCALAIVRLVPTRHSFHSRGGDTRITGSGGRALGAGARRVDEGQRSAAASRGAGCRISQVIAVGVLGRGRSHQTTSAGCHGELSVDTLRELVVYACDIARCTRRSGGEGLEFVAAKPMANQHSEKPGQDIERMRTSGRWHPRHF